ncbi:carbonic anhydrase [Epithele typhae]|uniref:carbonic anhydrase n=1 Tax=Epithele typhae TaxID=378194 RepID=UPI002008E405|nr:carbonic anhydrase [Epithele typhae]KAH9915940.1 carbonic anhydrase [Epithele typhae]
MSHDYVLARLLVHNELWAKEITAKHPHFFKDLAKNQTPKVLWIGCADSRVPQSVVTASLPGDIFVHRNIANQFHPADDNAVSALAYAVEHVAVEHILVVGHTGCGGVKAAQDAAGHEPPAPPETPLDRWLAPLVALARAHPGGDLTALVEANVRAQVDEVVKSDVVTEAWAKDEPKGLEVHGWVYELETGRLRDLDYGFGKQGRL